MLWPHSQRCPMLELLMASQSSSESCGFKWDTGCSGGMRALAAQIEETRGSTDPQRRKEGRKKKEKIKQKKSINWEKTRKKSQKRSVSVWRVELRWTRVSSSHYHSPGKKRVCLHWKHFCQCLPGNASWISWSDGDASSAGCRSASPSALPSADPTQGACQWSSLSRGTGQKQQHNLSDRAHVLRLSEKRHHKPHLPTTCGRVDASRSSMMVPFSMQALSSIRLCKDSVATWGLLQRSPPFSTFSSNLIHLGREGKAFSVPTLRGSIELGSTKRKISLWGCMWVLLYRRLEGHCVV